MATWSVMWKARRRHVVFQRRRREESFGVLNGFWRDSNFVISIVSMSWSRKWAIMMGRPSNFLGKWKKYYVFGSVNSLCSLTPGSWVQGISYPWVGGIWTPMILNCLVPSSNLVVQRAETFNWEIVVSLGLMNEMRLIELLIEGSPNSEKKGLTQLLLTFLTWIRSLFRRKLISTSLTWVHVSGQNVETPMIVNAFTLLVIHCNRK